MQPAIMRAPGLPHLCLGRNHPRAAELPERIALGHQALNVMEIHLAEHPHFVADRVTIADIALYAYTHVAHELGIDLTSDAHIRAWLGRVASQSGHIHMTSH
jgi:glutathione S-transferase